MSVISMKQLLEAGVHFGHLTRRWNPKMAEYIFTERNGIYIIDLQKTVKKVEEAYMFIRDTVADGGEILFVGTKKQAQDSVKEEAERCGMYFVNARWLGGMLTNFKTIKTRIVRLKKLRQMEEDGTFDLLPKKEVIKLKLEIERLEKYLGGIKEMKKIPDAIFVVDPKKERNAILEARKLNVPIVAIMDTNCDPDEADYIIPGNDDAIRAVKLLSGVIADAVIEGKQGESFAEAEVEEKEQEEQIEEKLVKALKEKFEGNPIEEIPLEQKPKKKAVKKDEEKVEVKKEEKEQEKTTKKSPAKPKAIKAEEKEDKKEDKKEVKEKSAPKAKAKEQKEDTQEKAEKKPAKKTKEKEEEPKKA